MSEVINNQVFQGKGHLVKTATFSMSTGTAKLQKLAGTDPDSDTWVDVADSSLSASGDFSFYTAEGQRYRFVLTGDAAGVYS